MAYYTWLCLSWFRINYFNAEKKNITHMTFNDYNNIIYSLICQNKFAFNLKEKIN